MKDLTKPIEEIRWIDADDKLPDPLSMVLVFIPNESVSVRLGYRDSNGWCVVAGVSFDLPVIAFNAPVAAWAKLPQGPGN